MLVSFVLYPVMGMRAYIYPVSRIVGNSVLFPLIARLTCTDLIYVRTKSVSPCACWSSVLAVAVSTSSGCGFDSDLHAVEQCFLHFLDIFSIHVIFNWIIVVILLLSCLNFVQFVGCHHSVTSWLLPLGLGFAVVASTFGCYPQISLFTILLKCSVFSSGSFIVSTLVLMSDLFFIGFLYMALIKDYFIKGILFILLFCIYL